MGLWWKTVKDVPKGGFVIKGNPKAWPKWNPFWRLQHEWQIFRVEANGEPYHVFFDDGVDKMLCKKVIKTEYFMARIGQRNIEFMATINLSNTESLPIFCDPERIYGWVYVNDLIVSDSVTKI